MSAYAYVYIYIYLREFVWTSYTNFCTGRSTFKRSAAVAIAALASCAAVAAIVAHRVPPKCDDDWSQGSGLKSTACAFAVLLDSL